MKLPGALLQSLEGITGFDKEAFMQVHASGEQVTSIRINPAKCEQLPLSSAMSGPLEKVPWCNTGYYLPNRPSFTFDPLFHAGCYYVQEASSMFLEQALLQTTGLARPLKVLDLCASPGGKSTHLQSLISKESVLVSNEVIRGRANVLKDNIIKWGGTNVVVTNNDPGDFAKLESYFDVIVVDAPCSGSGLFRKDPGAIAEWSENNVQLCSQRQQRILADVLPALKKDGILIYSTCSYSATEDEDITAWLVKQYPLIPEQLIINNEWNVTRSGGGFRFWPDKLQGEGFFMAVFRKTEGEDDAAEKGKARAAVVDKAGEAILENWVNPEGIHFVRNENTIYAWPEIQFRSFDFLLQQMRVLYAGVLIGDLLRDKLIPAHALAMSNICRAGVQRENLDEAAAVQYLQRKTVTAAFAHRGWTLACYKDHPLGWMNVLPGRMNNYYPKELRILKESPGIKG